MNLPIPNPQPFRAACLLAGLLACASALAQDIVVEKKTEGTIPITISGYTGEVDQTLKFDLFVAGFDLVGPEKATYRLSGKNTGDVEGTLADASQHTIFARAYPGGTPRAQAHALADDIAQAAGRKGIAQSRILFRLETGRRNARNEYVSEVYLADYDGANAHPLTEDGTIVKSPAWGAGRKSVYYTSFRAGNADIYSHDLASGSRAPVARFSGINDGAALSPDGSRLAMILSRAGSPDLWLTDANGANPRQLTKTPESESSPTWSPDGRTICYSYHEGPNASRLYLIPADGGTARPLNTGGVRNATEPDWSPDGKWIAFTRAGGGQNFLIYVVPASGGEARLVGDGEDPSWGPNSRTLLVTKRSKNGQKRLSLLDAPTGRSKDVTSISGSCSQPSWAR